MAICEIIDNDSTWVVRCDETGDGHPVDRRPGRFGVDEDLVVIPSTEAKLGM